MARRPSVWPRKGRGWWTKVKGRQIKLSDSSREEALAALARILELDQEKLESLGPRSVRPKLTVKELMDRWIADCRSRLSARTVETYEFTTGSFIAFCGSMNAEDIRVHHVSEWLAKQNWNRSSRSTYGGHIRIAFRWACDQDLLETYHFTRLKLPSIQRRAPTNPDDIARFRAGIKSPELLDWFDISIACGARPGELVGLSAKHIARDLSQAIVTGKKGKRTIYFPESVKPILERLIARHPEGPILRNRDGKPWRVPTLDDRFRVISRRTGVHIVPYNSRHRFCTESLRVNGEILTAKLLGHKDLKMISRFYDGRDETDLRDAIKRLDETPKTSAN